MSRNAFLTTLGVLVLAAIVLFTFFLWQRPMSNGDVSVQFQYPTKIVYTTDEEVDQSALQSDCAARGGTFDTCGTTCAPDADSCIEVCAFVCHLQGGAVSSVSSASVSSSRSSTGAIATGTTAWDTYESPDGTFSISYRTDMRVEEDIGGPMQVRFQLWGPTQTTGTEVFDGISIGIRQETYGSASVSLEAFAEQEAEDVTPVGQIIQPVHAVTVAGIQGYAYTAESLGRYTNYYLPIENGDALVVSVLVSDPGNRGFAGVSSRMVESIRLE